MRLSGTMFQMNRRRQRSNPRFTLPHCHLACEAVSRGHEITSWSACIYGEQKTHFATLPVRQRASSMFLIGMGSGGVKFPVVVTTHTLDPVSKATREIAGDEVNNKKGYRDFDFRAFSCRMCFARSS